MEKKNRDQTPFSNSANTLDPHHLEPQLSFPLVDLTQLFILNSRNVDFFVVVVVGFLCELEKATSLYFSDFLEAMSFKQKTKNYKIGK